MTMLCTTMWSPSLHLCVVRVYLCCDADLHIYQVMDSSHASAAVQSDHEEEEATYEDAPLLNVVDAASSSAAPPRRVKHNFKAPHLLFDGVSQAPFSEFEARFLSSLVLEGLGEHLDKDHVDKKWRADESDLNTIILARLRTCLAGPALRCIELQDDAKVAWASLRSEFSSYTSETEELRSLVLLRQLMARTLARCRQAREATGARNDRAFAIAAAIKPLSTKGQVKHRICPRCKAPIKKSKTLEHCHCK